MANGNSGESGATNLGPRSKVLVENTQALVAYWHQRGVNPHPDPRDHLGQWSRPDLAAGRHRADPMVSKATGISPSTHRRSSPRRPTAQSLASSVAVPSTSCN